MSEWSSGGFEAAVAQLEAAVTALQAAVPTPLSDGQVVDAAAPRGGGETSPCSGRARGRGCGGAAVPRRDTSVPFHRDVPVRAAAHRPRRRSARVKGAAALSPRVPPSGGVVDARFPAVAAALESGSISARHAQVITRRGWTRCPTRSSTTHPGRERPLPTAPRSCPGELTAQATEALLGALDALTKPTDSVDAAGSGSPTPAPAGSGATTRCSHSAWPRCALGYCPTPAVSPAPCC